MLKQNPRRIFRRELVELSAAVNFLEANQELLNPTDPVAFLRLRADNAQLLNRFRLSPGDLSRELRDLDGDEFAERARELFEREIGRSIGRFGCKGPALCDCENLWPE